MLRESINKLSEYLLELFYPTRCPFCGRLSGVPEPCPDCSAGLPAVPEALREQHFKNLECTVSPLYYDGMVSKSILRYKFGGCSSYCRTYAQIIAKNIDLSRYSCDYISWVPLSSRRLRSRGYNQAELIARELSKLTGLQCGPVLKKIKDNPTQSGTASPEERKRNVRGVYRLKKGCEVRGRRIILVDDVVTTGSTLSECAGILRGSGAAVVGVTVARSKV